MDNPQSKYLYICDKMDEKHKDNLPYKLINNIPDKENELLIKSFSIKKIFAYDLGSTWLENKINPVCIGNSLVHNGYAIANIDDNLCIHGYEDYISNNLMLLNKYYENYFKNKDINGYEHYKSHELIQNKIKSLSDEKKEKCDLCEILFNDQIKILESYLEWDLKYLSDYLDSERFSRMVFYPLMIKFQHSDESFSEFMPVQVLVTVHKTGVCCITMWFFPFNSNELFNTEKIMGLKKLPWDTQVIVAVPKKLSNFVLKQIKIAVDEGFEPALVRVNELDIKMAESEYIKKYNKKYECWKGKLKEISTLFSLLINETSLFCMNKDINKINMDKFNYSYYSYDIMNIYEVDGITIDNSFDQIVKAYPRQILGITESDENYHKYTENYLRKLLVDVSYYNNETVLFSINTMLNIINNEDWNNLKSENSSNILWKPDFWDVGYASLFEFLCCIRVLLNNYDTYLSKILHNAHNIKKLTKIHKKMILGLEEIVEERYMRYANIDEWWWLAKKRIRIEILNRSVKYKLDDIYQIIVNQRQELVNKIQIILTAFSKIQD